MDFFYTCDTPYKNEKFWKKIKSNINIEQFDKEFNLIEEIKKFGLSDFVHTKGIWYSNFGEFQRKLKGQDKFENYKEWLENFKEIVPPPPPSGALSLSLLFF